MPAVFTKKLCLQENVDIWKNYINRSAAGAAGKEKLHIHRWEEYLIRRRSLRVLASVIRQAELICRILPVGKKQESLQAQRCYTGRYVNGAVSKVRRHTASTAGYLIKRRQFPENVSVTHRECLICRTHHVGKNKAQRRIVWDRIKNHVTAIRDI